MPTLKQEIKDFARLEKILVVLAEEGLGYYLARARLHIHLPFFKKIAPHHPASSQEQLAVRLRRALERLGGTFIKLGQLLSVRPDLVPAVFSKELEKLQDRVPPFSYSAARKIVEEELKQPLEQTFKLFERKPLASASIAQVHKAVLKSGEVAAVKVQRPDIQEIFNADLDILFYLAKMLEKNLPNTKRYQPVNVVKEFALWTRKELNFQIEAEHAVRIKESLKENKQVFIPKIYHNYTTPRVLTMEFVEGIKLDHFSALRQQKINLPKIAAVYFQSILEQALLHGIFHADPHPANILVGKNKKLIFLDFGIVGELTEEDQQKIVNFILSIDEKDPEKSINIILSLAKEIRNGELQEFKMKTTEILRDVFQHSLRERSVGKALYEIISLGAQYGIIFNPNHVLMTKALYQAEGLCFKLAPEFKIAEGLEKFSEKYLEEQLAPKNILHKVSRLVAKQRSLLLNFPDRFIKVMQRWEEPPAPVHCEKEHLEELEIQLEEKHQQESLVLVIIVLVLASTFLLYAEGYQKIWKIPLSWISLGMTLITIIYFILLHRRSRRKLETAREFDKNNR